VAPLLRVGYAVGRLAASAALSWAFETLRADKIPGV